MLCLACEIIYSAASKFHDNKSTHFNVKVKVIHEHIYQMGFLDHVYKTIGNKKPSMI